MLQVPLHLFLSHRLYCTVHSEANFCLFLADAEAATTEEDAQSSGLEMQMRISDCKLLQYQSINWFLMQHFRIREATLVMGAFAFYSATGKNAFEKTKLAFLTIPFLLFLGVKFKVVFPEAICHWCVTASGVPFAVLLMTSLTTLMAILLLHLWCSDPEMLFFGGCSWCGDYYNQVHSSTKSIHCENIKDISLLHLDTDLHHSV